MALPSFQPGSLTNSQNVIHPSLVCLDVGALWSELSLQRRLSQAAEGLRLVGSYCG